MPLHGNQTHAFRPSGDHHLVHPAIDAMGGQGNRLKTGGTEAINGHGADLIGKSGSQRSDPSDVHPLFRFRHGAPQNHVLYLIRGQRLGSFQQA